MKITIVGSGNVGATVALIAAQKNLGNIVLVDIVDGIPQGKALDIYQSCPIAESSSLIIGSNRYEDTAGSDIVVITAGLARKPGMSREDLLIQNAKIVQGITTEIMKYSRNPILIIVTNPLDLMTYHAWKTSGLPAERVMGQAGILDGARFRAFIAERLNISPVDISTMVLGGHGDTMVPLPRYTCVSGIPIAEFLTPQEIETLAERTRNGGGEIVNLLKTGSAYYAPGSAAALMVEAIVLDQKRILPCSTYLNGKYGIKDIYIGVPVKLGRSGVEEVIELKLTPDELKALQKSALVYQEGIRTLYPHG